MKITGIEIGEYRQFKNIKFDFTYPADHAKAGQPLEKVCFIGQSGTGKTTLLNVIWELINTIAQAIEPHDGPFGSLAVDQKHLPYKLSDILYQVSYKINLGSSTVEFKRGTGEGDVSDDALNRSYVSNWIKNYLSPDQRSALMIIEKCGLLIRDSIAQEASAFLTPQESIQQSFSDFVKSESEIEQDRFVKESVIKASALSKSVDLGQNKSLSLWQYLLRDVREYDDMGKDLAVEIIQKAGAFSADRMISELVRWKKNTTNPRNDLAENCLNPLVKHFFLEMDVESADVPVVMKTKQGVKIDSKYLSMGTRQLLSTAIPIYKLDTTGTVILFDEPERSLFPDIQRELVKYYMSLAPEAQFFFATHSPIIASAFEPCERFILYFDEQGGVKCHNGVAPEGDDPNDILRQDFGMSPLMLEKGVEEYQRYLDLATKIKNEPDNKRKMELIAERAAIGNQYNFSATDETN